MDSDRRGKEIEATITVDDSITQTSPAIFTDLRPGHHLAKISKDNYRSISKTFDIKDQDSKDTVFYIEKEKGRAVSRNFSFYDS